MRLGSSSNFSRPAARRFIRDLEEDWMLMLRLCDADSRGLKTGMNTLDLEMIFRQIESVLTEAPKLKFESPISGKQIMDLLDISSGPMIGQIKQFLLQKVLDGELNMDDVETAKTLAQQYLEKCGGRSPQNEPANLNPPSVN